MNNQQALSILINAVKAANKAGAFTLEDSAVIAQAVALFTAPAPKVDTAAQKQATPVPAKKK